MKNENYFKLANAPEDQPLAFDLDQGKLHLDKDAEDDDSTISLDDVNSVAKMKATIDHSRPKWLQEFFASMNDYVSQASKNAEIDLQTGQLSLSTTMPKSHLRKVVEHLAWLYEAQYRQNKEILLWIGELILDYMARDQRDLTIEEAIEELGFLKRENGVRWRLRTLARWPIVVQRIPSAIRQLPIPPTYLSEAALFAQPEEPTEKIRFCNARDALLVAVADKPDSWSRSKFVACMKELQDKFGMERQRNEGVAALLERLIAYYRLQREAAISLPNDEEFYRRIGMTGKDIAEWIYNIESELQNRGKIPPDPKDSIPKGDGLTKRARERLERIKAEEAAKREGKRK